ncbi:MAG: hypothetical protein AABZ57_02135 [Candidatus Margulisiibacteriota bacterium]
MVSVGIIIPSWHYWLNPSRIQPIYEMYFATVIDQKFQGEADVCIIDTRGVKADQQVYHIPKKDIYLYWIPKTGDYSRMKELASEIKKAYPGSKHAAGGTHIDIFFEESSRDFDSVVVGPGEESFVQIIKDARDGKLKKIYKTDYKDVHYGNYPFMRRHYLPETAAVNNLLFEKYGANIRSTCVLFSRGCVFKCKFCVYNVPSMVQMRPIESIK